MKYISQPPLLLDVHIHKPLLPARTWMDSLLAFFPGLQVSCIETHSLCKVFCSLYKLYCFSQVLKGDIRPAIETHEMLYQVTKKHNFLPEVMSLYNLGRCLQFLLYLCRVDTNSLVFNMAYFIPVYSNFSA